MSVDERSLTAQLEPGLRGPEVEAALAPRGLTLGHFPQSFEYATLGGFVATRSAGQASTGYGRIDDLVLGVRCAAPAGDLDLPARPASAAGPELRRLVVGSEGTLGVITRAALRLHRAPEARRYEAWFFRSFVEGAEALRTLEQAGQAPDVARLSDESETALSMALAGHERTRAPPWAAPTCGLRRYSGGALAIAGWEGTAQAVDRRRGQAAAVLRRAGGLAVGRSPGRAWERGRFSAPYLRDDLLDRGVMVETLETAAQWSDLMAVYDAVLAALDRALSARGTPPQVGCHISHLYPSGASLYFTFLARQQAGRGDRAVAGGQAGRRRRDRGRRRDDHPPPRGGARPRPLDGRRGGGDGDRRPARSQARARSHRDHEPGQAGAGGICGGRANPAG